MKTKWRMTLALAAMVAGMFAATLTVSAEERTAGTVGAKPAAAPNINLRI